LHKERIVEDAPDLRDAVQSIGWLRNQRPDEVEGERTAKFELNLSEVIVTSTLLNEADFSLVSLRVSDLKDSEFRLAKFWQAEFYGASLVGVRAQWSDFSSAILEDTKLQDAEFDSCTFERAILVAAEFDHTRLIDCNISGANFMAATGLTSEAIKSSWAWKDDPPELPSNVDFDNYVDAGRNGVHRENYRKEREYQKGHSRPS
jgi:uncharacterized protein YjbI with pentapeptide repeats